MTTDKLVVSDDNEIDDTEDLDYNDYLAEEADQWWLLWKAILHLILKTKQSVWSFPQIGCLDEKMTKPTILSLYIKTYVFICLNFFKTF